MYIARAAQHAKLRLIIPALAVAIAALIVPLSQIASAHAATRAAASGGPKPTIVLETEPGPTPPAGMPSSSGCKPTGTPSTRRRTRCRA